MWMNLFHCLNKSISRLDILDHWSCFMYLSYHLSICLCWSILSKHPLVRDTVKSKFCYHYLVLQKNKNSDGHSWKYLVSHLLITPSFDLLITSSHSTLSSHLLWYFRPTSLWKLSLKVVVGWCWMMPSMLSQQQLRLHPLLLLLSHHHRGICVCMTVMVILQQYPSSQQLQ